MPASVLAPGHCSHRAGCAPGRAAVPARPSGTASAKLAVLERIGYALLGYFVLPEHCWLDAYYRPMRQRFPAFLARHGRSDAARAVVAAEELEISLYERYRAFVGYGYYIARKTDDVS